MGGGNGFMVTLYLVVVMLTESTETLSFDFLLPGLILFLLPSYFLHLSLLAKMVYWLVLPFWFTFPFGSSLLSMEMSLVSWVVIFNWYTDFSPF